jgi:hypothetical protein
MTIPLFILATFLPSIGLEPTPSDIALPALADLLRESWRGTWMRFEQTDAGASLKHDMLTLPAVPAWTARLTPQRRTTGFHPIKFSHGWGALFVGLTVASRSGFTFTQFERSVTCPDVIARSATLHSATLW